MYETNLINIISLLKAFLYLARMIQRFLTTCLLLVILVACGKPTPPDVRTPAAVAFSDETRGVLKLDFTSCTNTKARELKPKRLFGTKTPGHMRYEYSFTGKVEVNEDCWKESTDFKGYPANLFYNNTVVPGDEPPASLGMDIKHYIPLKQGREFVVKGEITFIDYEEDRMDYVKVRITEYK